jgi:hypothetical protein
LTISPSLILPYSITLSTPPAPLLFVQGLHHQNWGDQNKSCSAMCVLCTARCPTPGHKGPWCIQGSFPWHYKQMSHWGVYTPGGYATTQARSSQVF